MPTTPLPKLEGILTHSSLWRDIPMHDFPSLNRNLEAEVCIIGGGIAGLTCAYNLAVKGVSVVLLEQGEIAGGQTGQTTGHLTWVLDDRFSHLEFLMGKDHAQKAVKSHLSAVEFIEKIITTEKIECDFEKCDAFLFNAPGHSLDILNKESDFVKEMHLDVETLPRAPFNSTFETGLCLRFPGQAQFHVMKYLQGLVQALLRFKNVQIFCDTHASEISDGRPCHVNTLSGQQITAQNVIVATCTPVNNRFYVHTKQAAYRTYVIAASIAKNSLPRGLYYDTDDPYHYIRLQKNKMDPHLDWILIGGEDHRVGQDFSEQLKFSALEEWARQRISGLGKVEYQWSGEIFEPIDSLAFIGKNPKDQHTYIVTGDSGNGLTHGTIAGMLLPELILNNEHPWESIYEPSRKNLKATNEFVKDLSNAAFQYKDWLTPGESIEIQNLESNEGVVIRRGMKKFAVYKNENNEISVVSASCPHLGGCVRWNSTEKTWDCPCHGSSFDRFGNVLCGPSIDSLSKVTKDDL